MDFDNVGTGTETVASTENSSESETEDSEENGLIHIEPDHQDPSEFWDEEEDSSNFIPWYENTALFSPAIKNVFFDEDYNGVELETRAYWGPNDTFQTVKASGVGNVTIGPAFSSWEWPVGTDKWLKVEAIFLAAKNSINATNARIDKTNTEVGKRALKTTVDNAFTRIAKLETDLLGHKNWATGAIVDLRSTDDYINGKVNTLRSDFTGHTNWATDAVVKLRERATDIDTKLVGHMNWATDAVVKLRDRATDIDTKLENHKTWASGAITDLRSTDDYINGKVNTLRSDFTGHTNWATDAVVKLRERATDIDTKLVGHMNWATDAVVKLRDRATDIDTKLENHKTWASGAITDLRSTDDYINGKVNDLGTWKNVQLAWNTTQELEMMDLRSQLSSLGDFDDSGIIGELKEIQKSWYSDDYWTPTLLKNDGGLVRLIKSQFQRLYELVFSLLNAFRDGGIFWLAWEANLPKLGKLITECLDTSTPGTPLYAMRYSMTEGFMELQEAVEYATGKIRDNQVTEMTNQETMISALEEIRDHTAIVTQWLKLIYEKPTGSFIESPFDFDRLEKILNDLNLSTEAPAYWQEGTKEEGWLSKWLRSIIGKLIDGAFDILGKTIEGGFSVLGTAIDTLGELLGKGIDGVASVLGDILDFLDGLLDKIIHLIVPEDTTFLDTSFATLKGKFQVKFGSILDLGGKVKDVFVPAKVDFFESTTFEIMGAKFRADKATADLFIPKFRVVMALFVWFEVAWFVYRKITGGGDMINDN